MKKLFRFHRGSLKDSLATITEVTGLDEIRHMVAKEMPFAHNVQISWYSFPDSRLPPEWGGYSRSVLADFDGYSGQCIGMCNFYEEA